MYYLKSILILLIFNFEFSIFNCSFAQDSVKTNGYQKFYYGNGKLSSEGNMRNGKPDGYWKSYSENGNLKSEGNRKIFELDSLWKFYNEDGKLILEVNFKNDRKNGIKTTYLDNETVKENFLNDVKDGLTKYFYKDGKLKMEVPFVKGVEQGLAKEYSPDGNIITLIEYKRGFIVERLKINRKDKDNLKQGKSYVFHANGNVKQEGTYRDDKKDGYFKDYAENGDLISVTKYVNDVKQTDAEEVTKLDLQNEYYPDGKIKITETYRNGIPEGIRREYSEDGQILKSFIYSNGKITGEGIIKEDGVKEGLWKEYYSDSTLKSEGEYKDDKKTGEWKYFYPDGKLEQAGKYTGSGKFTGKWKWFFPSGQLMLEEEYLNGMKDGMHIEYDESGKITEEGEYVKDLEDGNWFTYSGDWLERGIYRDGLRNGKWVSYNLVTKEAQTDSILIFAGNFIEDNPDGKHFYYWDNGKLKEEGLYIMGKKEGDWLLYNYDGSPFLIINYKNGIEVKYDGVRIKPPFEAEEQ